MDKHYNFKEFESEFSNLWQLERNNTGKPYTIIMPPPNVTGSLHLGHALSSTLQDILIRHNLMKGMDVLWVPGTDHAGIATQMMVEKELEKEGLSRIQLGREEFLKRVWNWKDRYGHIIIDQMKRLGFLADWSRHCFTLDPAMNDAVNEAFVRLYKNKLIYRAERLVNWDTTLQTALSDLEVISKPETGKLWTIRYYLNTPCNGTLAIDVATTRPETLFGDVAVAVHPDDVRYKHIIGKLVKLPLTDLLIPIIADKAVDPKKGTGAVKITPAHDFLDFEIAGRQIENGNHLSFITIFDDNACLNENVPSKFIGLDRDTARNQALLLLGDQLIGEETISHSVPYSDRSGSIIEPKITFQWYIEMNGMAAQAIKAVKDKRTRFFPEEWESRFFEWLDNIQPWCVSRQLWWGHRIPAWFGPEESIFVAMTEEQAYEQARQRFGDNVKLRQDTDVLDTWFSSGLWPFSTLGWPKDIADIERRYPTDVLVTGFDILFFWVARMMMLGLEMTGDVPFRAVCIHPLIRDEKGQKMSKTKQNVINPMDLLDDYGADAIRFSLTMASAGKQFMSFSKTNVEHGRNFMTKIWNTARMLIMNEIFNKGMQKQFTEKNNFYNEFIGKPKLTLPLTKWIDFELNELINKVTKAIEHYNFHDAALALHNFTWHIFCDRYIEFVKDELHHEKNEQILEEIRQMTRFSFTIILRLLQPFIPFITEKIWTTITRKQNLYHESWPEVSVSDADSVVDSVGPLKWIMEIMTIVRRVRSEFSLTSSVPIEVFLYDLTENQQKILDEHKNQLTRLLFLERLEGHIHHMPKHFNGVCIPIHYATLVIPISHLVDLEAEKNRLILSIAKEKAEKNKLYERINNTEFLSHAPEAVICDLQQRFAEKEAILINLQMALSAVSSPLSES